MKQIISQLNKKAIIFGFLIGAILIYFVSSFTTERRLNEYQLSLETSATYTRTEVQSLVDLIARGDATPATTKIIVDCTPEERIQFETLLMQLDAGLSRQELSELDNLFGRCASVVSVRRALTLMELSQKVESLETLVTQRKQVGTFEELDAYLADLRALVSAEQSLTELSFMMIYLQREIIDTLQAGDATEEQLNELRAEGARLRNELQQVAQSLKSLRTALLEHDESL